MSLPAKTKSPKVRVGDVRIPVEVELDPTAPHIEARAAHAAAAVHRSRKVEGVLALPDDVGVVEVGEDALDGASSLDVDLELVAAVVGTTVAVLPAVVVTDPEGNRREDETAVEGLCRVVGVA